MSLNRYTYCHNDPVNFIDPSGHLEKLGKFPGRSEEIRRPTSSASKSSSSSSSKNEKLQPKGNFEHSNEIRRPVYSNTDNQTSYLLEYGSFNLKGNFKHNDDNLITRPSLGFDKIVKPNHDEVLINRSHEYDDQVLVRDYLKNNYGMNDSDIYYQGGFVNIYDSLIKTNMPLIIDGLRIHDDRAYATPESINRAVQAYINSFDEIQKGVNDALLANKMDNKESWNYRAGMHDTFAVALDLYSKGMISANEVADIYGYVRAFATIDVRIANNNLIAATKNLTDATLKAADAYHNYNTALIKKQQAMDDYLISLKQYGKMQEEYKANLTKKLAKAISNKRIVNYNGNEITVTDGAGNIIEHKTLQDTYVLEILPINMNNTQGMANSGKTSLLKTTLNVTIDFTAGVAVSGDNNLFFGAVQGISGKTVNNNSIAFQAGKVFGDTGSMIAGVYAIIGGAGGEVIGVALDGTVVLAPAGIATAAASAGLIGYGGTATYKGATNYFKDANDLISNITQWGSKTIKNSAGQEVDRKLVNNQDELLEEAEKAAGGSLDNFDNYKPGWWLSKDGKTKIEWEPGGHSNTNEGPHATVRQQTSDGKWKVVDKIFIKGQETYK